MPSIESQENFRKEVNDAEEKFKQDSIAYLQRLINEREKTKPKLTNPWFLNFPRFQDCAAWTQHRLCKNLDQDLS